MTRRHLPWGWSWGCLSSLQSAAAACPVPHPPAPSRLPLSLLLAGLFKISSMEKDRPSFLGASQHPESFLSIPRLGTLRGQLGGGQKGLVDALEMLVAVAASSPETPGIKRAGRGGELGASCRISRLPRDFHGPLTPRIEVRVTWEELDCLSPSWLQSSCTGSSPGGPPPSLTQAWSSEVTASGQQGTEQDGGEACPQGRAGAAGPPSCPFLWLTAFPAGSG